MLLRRIPIPVNITLRYDPVLDPLAVTATFSDVGVTWVFARQLLIDGLRHGQSGMADVRTRRHGACLDLLLDSPDGQGILQMPARQVARWLRSTLRLVPEGQEMPDIDSMLEELFKS